MVLETVIKESDSKGKSSGLESSIKPRELHINTNSSSINENCKNHVYNQVISGQVYLKLM